MQTHAMTHARHGLFLHDHQDDFVERRLDVYREWSRTEIRLFQQLVAAGDMVIEAGSNIGSRTAWFSSALGEIGRVIALKPQRHVYHVLCANLAPNERFNVDARHGTLVRTDGQVEIPVISPREQFNFGAISCHTLDAVNHPTLLRAIDSLTLDQMGFFKANIESFEIEILHRAGRTHRAASALDFPRIHRPLGKRGQFTGCRRHDGRPGLQGSPLLGAAFSRRKSQGHHAQSLSGRHILRFSRLRGKNSPSRLCWLWQVERGKRRCSRAGTSRGLRVGSPGRYEEGA